MNVLQKLYDLTRFTKVKSSLTNVRKLYEACGSPTFKAIHVAGTNGKGSVSLKIAAGLPGKVGLYTSPHISSFKERITINGIPISDAEVEKHLTRLFALGIPATFFEITTILAFLHFAEVDYAVIEVGLGGRLDATNIITPILSVITSISYDHSHILGNTLEKIAYEKAGIIKQNVPVIVGPNVPLPIFIQAAKEKSAPLIQAPPSSHPFYDQENNSIAKTALHHLGLTDIAKALTVRPKCRLEIINNIVLDVAHNPDAFLKLKTALLHHFPDKKFRFLLAFSQDKDIPACLSTITSMTKEIHFVRTPNVRLADPERLATLVNFPTHTSHDVITEVQNATRLAYERNEILVISGSFFIMSAARQALGFHDEHDQYEFQEKYALVSE